MSLILVLYVFELSTSSFLLCRCFSFTFNLFFTAGRNTIQILGYNSLNVGEIKSLTKKRRTNKYYALEEFVLFIQFQIAKLIKCIF